jgi:DNA-directed RNA polymerase subunit alpha
MHRNWRELIKPKKVEVESDERDRFYGKFSCEPLERGFGITLGNALRAVLLFFPAGSGDRLGEDRSGLHEFSTVPGVVRTSATSSST